jgi:hypothetical protein
MIKENIFNNIDSKEKAYWLGFIYADGGIKGRAVTLCLSTKDEILVDRFIKFLGDSKTKKRFYSCILNDKKFYSVHYSVRNDKIIFGLKNNGCFEKKTTRIRLPNLTTEDLFLSFLLGFYDGDGCQNSTVVCSKSKNFLLDIKQQFNIPYNVRLKTNPLGSVYIMSLGRPLWNKMMAVFSGSLPRKRIILYKKKKKDGSYCAPRKKAQISLSDIELLSLGKEKSAKEMGLMFGFSEQSIRRIFKRRNLRIANKHEKYKKFNPTKKELEKLVNNHSMTQVGKIYGVSDNAVRKRCKRMGIALVKKF